MLVGHEHHQGWIQDFKLGGAHLNKLRRAEGDAKIFGVFRVKNHDFTPKNHIVSNCGGWRENFWDISCEKSRFYAKKSYFFQFRRAPPPPLDPPLITTIPVYSTLHSALCESRIRHFCVFPKQDRIYRFPSVSVMATSVFRSWRFCE